MEHIDFFKLQAKNFLRDYKTQFVNDESGGIYDYVPRFFDVNDIVLSFDIDEDAPFGLMNAQHIIAVLAGFKKWTELIKATSARLELGKLLFIAYQKNESDVMTNFVPSIFVDEWEVYLRQSNLENLDDESKLEIYKKVFIDHDENAKMESRKKMTIVDLEEMKKGRIMPEGATEETMQQMDKILGTNNIFQSRYSYFFADLENLYISKSDGVERIKTELNNWDKKA